MHDPNAFPFDPSGSNTFSVFEQMRAILFALRQLRVHLEAMLGNGLFQARLHCSDSDRRSQIHFSAQKSANQARKLAGQITHFCIGIPFEVSGLELYTVT
jgi:hypothetical protein